MAKTLANAAALTASLKRAKEAQARAFADSVTRAAEYGYARIQERLRGRVLRYRSGNLARSVTRTVKPSKRQGLKIEWSAGGGRVKYARIHEFGGVIKGRPWLRIPLTQGGKTRRKGDRITRGGVILRRGQPVAVLRRSVVMPKREYMRPSAEEALTYLKQDLAETVAPARREAL